MLSLCELAEEINPSWEDLTNGQKPGLCLDWLRLQSNMDQVMGEYDVCCVILLRQNISFLSDFLYCTVSLALWELSRTELKERLKTWCSESNEGTSGWSSKAKAWVALKL